MLRHSVDGGTDVPACRTGGVQLAAVQAMGVRRAGMMVSAVPVTSTHKLRTHTIVPIERIPLALTVGRDLRKRRSAQRFPAFS
jgi:hypothetical protein